MDSDEQVLRGEPTVRRRHAFMYATVLLAGALAVLGVTFAIYWQNTKADQRAAHNLSIAQARDQWARYDGQVEDCKRANIIRYRISSLSSAVVAVNDLLVQFFDSSARFRRTAQQEELARESEQARNVIKGVASNLKPVPLANCFAIRQPFVPRPLPVNAQ